MSEAPGERGPSIWAREPLSCGWRGREVRPGELYTVKRAGWMFKNTSSESKELVCCRARCEPFDTFNLNHLQ